MSGTKNKKGCYVSISTKYKHNKKRKLVSDASAESSLSSLSTNDSDLSSLSEEDEFVSRRSTRIISIESNHSSPASPKLASNDSSSSSSYYYSSAGEDSDNNEINNTGTSNSSSDPDSVIYSTETNESNDENITTDAEKRKDSGTTNTKRRGRPEIEIPDYFAPLFKDSKVSLLLALELLIDLQVTYKISDFAMTRLFDLLAKVILPDGNSMPSLRMARKIITEIGGENVKEIHSCFNDCICYVDSINDEHKVNQFANLEQCPECSEQRYIIMPNGFKRPRKVTLFWSKDMSNF